MRNLQNHADSFALSDMNTLPRHNILAGPVIKAGKQRGNGLGKAAERRGDEPFGPNGAPQPCNFSPSKA